MTHQELKAYLDEKAAQYEHPSFIQSDPIQIVHQFSRKEDIEIAALLTATIAWGQRTTIIRNAQIMMELMDHAPFDFILGHKQSDIARMRHFVHRTFNNTDLEFFVSALHHIYLKQGGLEEVFCTNNDPKTGIVNFKQKMCIVPHAQRSEKHISDPSKGSSAKRLNMFLRWMCRSPKRGVDFGIWQMSTANLHCPLDVHTGRVARALGLLKRKQNDWAAVEELSGALRQMDANDPVKYDFALFGIGAFEDVLP